MSSRKARIAAANHSMPTPAAAVQHPGLSRGRTVAGDSVGLSLNGGHYSSDNYRDNNRVVQDNIVADLRNFDPDHNLNLKFGYDKQDLRLPGNRTEAEFGDGPSRD